ncbi:CDP-glycerol glycerophosphotransferase family protein [Virgibacillus halophilus]|uniref:CDP-glycerol glycerophosphotransferase family protein n=1 Tax=Tigheibacillus halophilus TaxID=361280 RepID=A0ABU5C5M7_9BACI|nr:CDP-glycerol glycerophosphotransferase family protein [Virgibacillus halophilus]
MKYLRFLKNIYVVIYKICFQVVYKCACLLRKQDSKKMVIALYRTDQLDDNLRLVYREVLKQNPEMKIHLVHGVNKMNLKLFKEIIVLSNARYLVLDDYYLPIYLVEPDKQLKVVQLWHAAGAFKKFGHSTVGSKFGPTTSYLKLVPIHSNYDFVYISAQKFASFYAEAFHMNLKRIFALGIPRTDLLTNAALSHRLKTEMHKVYPFLENKNNVHILMAPTYRAKGSHHETQLDVAKAVIELSSLLNRDKCIIFKPHPYMNSSSIEELRKCPNIIVADSRGINEWMLVADAFITDYSSSVFEFALMHKPMAHFVPDLDEYRENRGFYTDIESISDAAVIQETNQLAAWINARNKGEYFDSSRMISYNFDHVDHATARIVKHFLSTEK